MRHLTKKAVALGVAAIATTLIAGNARASNGEDERKQSRRSVLRSTEITRASWYGPRFVGRATASGRVFDPDGLSGAHRSLPLGSEVRVTNLENGRSVVLPIDDRGPYVEGRGIDVSREAARRLGMMRNGVVKVRIDLLPSTRDLAPIPVSARGASLLGASRTRALLQ